MALDFSTSLAYVATLSVATERATEMIKNIPGLSNFLSTRTTGTMENVRLICVHLLAVIVGIVLCSAVPALAPEKLQIFSNAATNQISTCIVCGLLASGGSGFWNSALDTFRSYKQKMTSLVPAPTPAPK